MKTSKTAMAKDKALDKRMDANQLRQDIKADKKLLASKIKKGKK